MKEEIITIPYKVYEFSELRDPDAELVKQAREATKRSYAPYSRFHVGAAILMENGEIVCGSNQENAAFPSSLCAERTAAYYASASHPDTPMLKIAIAAWTRLHHADSDPYEACFLAQPISPCGACRQALLEYEAKYGDMEVLLCGGDKVYVFPSVKSLLPFAFSEF